jgi:hypothetical protein
MPSFYNSFSIQARSDHFGLALNSVHLLTIGSQNSDPVRNSKRRVPHDIDVLSTSHLVVTLSGSVDRIKVSPDQIRQSALALFLVRYFKLASHTSSTNQTTNLSCRMLPSSASPLFLMSTLMKVTICQSVCFHSLQQSLSLSLLKSC